MNSYILLHNGSDAEVKLQEEETYETITLRETDSDRNHMELTIFSEDKKFPAIILKVFGIIRGSDE